jgi:hypothetical protein
MLNKKVEWSVSVKKHCKRLNYKEKRVETGQNQ